MEGWLYIARVELVLFRPAQQWMRLRRNIGVRHRGRELGHRVRGYGGVVYAVYTPGRNWGWTCHEQPLGSSYEFAVCVLEGTLCVCVCAHTGYSIHISKRLWKSPRTIHLTALSSALNSLVYTRPNDVTAAPSSMRDLIVPPRLYRRHLTSRNSIRSVKLSPTSFIYYMHYKVLALNHYVIDF